MSTTELPTFKEEIEALLSPVQEPGACKFDENKPRYDLIPPEFLEGLAYLMGLGAKKYAERNCEKGTTWGRWYRAAHSHESAWWRKETYDPEDGQHHLLSAAWNLMMLYTYEIRGIGEDDRHTGNATRERMDSFWKDINHKPKAGMIWE